MEQNEQFQELLQNVRAINQKLAWFQERAESREKAKKRDKSLREYRHDNSRIYQELIDYAQDEEWDRIRFENAGGCLSLFGKTDAVYISIDVSVFHKFFQERNLSEKEFLHWALEQGLLLKGSDGRFSRVARYPGSSQISRFITLQLCVNDKENQD